MKNVQVRSVSMHVVVIVMCKRDEEESIDTLDRNKRTRFNIELSVSEDTCVSSFIVHTSTHNSDL